MRGNKCRLIGGFLAAFAAGTIVQIFLPDIFIVALFAGIILVMGLLMLKN